MIYGCCDIGDLQPAYYCGVEFWVHKDSEHYGRRIVTHEYPDRDDPYNEDLGEKAVKFNVQGYVVGDNARQIKNQLVEVCRAKGASMLQLPAVNRVMAVCNSLVVSRSKDEQCVFDLAFEFTLDEDAGPPVPFLIFETSIASEFLDVVDILRWTMADVFTATNVLPFVVSNAIYRVHSAAGSLLNVIEDVGATLDPVDVIEMSTLTIGMSQNAHVLVLPGPSDAPVESVVDNMASVFYKLMGNSAPTDIITRMETLAQFNALENVNSEGAASYGATGRDELFPPSEFTKAPSASIIKDENNASAFNGAVRVMALMTLANAVAAKVFTSRDEAISARATVVELFWQELQRTDDAKLSSLLHSARNKAVESLSSQAANIAPVIRVSSPSSAPSLYWAARLYNDATRCEELVERNKVSTAAFMPQVFDALAS